MSDLINASLQELAAALATRRVSAVELATLYLDRIERLNPRFNAFVTVEPDKTLAQARAADARLASGNAGPLAGIPLGYKDIFCTKGMLTTCGSKMLANFVAPYDAHVVERLGQAGVVNLGKLNMDEFAMGSSTENSCHGPTRNPWDTTRVPGGSSGGSAAAVAARLAPVTLGTDTGGSIRQPAAMCGLSGIKPTYGIVSRYGMVAYASSLDQGGPMARSAADCALVLNGIAGFDERDSTSLERPAEDYTCDLAASVKGLRIGLPREFFAQGMDDDVRAAVDAALDVYRSLGAELIDVDLPNSGLSVPAYYVVAPAEASSNLSRYDGVRYGYRSPAYNDLVELYARSRAEGFGAEVKRRILVGTYVLSHGYYDAYYLKAQKLRRLIAEDFRAAFAQCDVIMGPTSPFVAFPIGAKADDPVQMYLSDIYTVSTNLAGLPGMSIPCGFGSAGVSPGAPNPMPVGLQILGPWFSEAKMLGIAHQYQLHTDWHQRMPEGVA